jgi:hypothetical protein
MLGLVKQIHTMNCIIGETVAHQPVSPPSGGTKAESGRQKAANERFAAFRLLPSAFPLLVISLAVALAAWAAQQRSQSKPELFPFAPADGVPAITDPAFVDAKKADAFLSADEPVLGLLYSGEARAYSVWQLERRLVVNDRFGSRAVAITWCPFSHAAVVYVRTAVGRRLTLESDGRLLRDQLALRDRETGTIWSQAEGIPVEGPLAGSGTRLSELPVLQTTWKTWKKEQPGTLVLEKAGADSAIRSSMYADYDADPQRLGLGHTELREPRMSGKALVVGIVSGGDRLAVPFEKVKNDLVVDVAADQQALAVVYDPATSTVRVVRREARGLTLSLRRGAGDLFGRPTPPYMIDEQTVSRWDLTGLATGGRMEGHRLPLVPYRLQYWYAWQACFPRSRVE